MSEIPAPGRRPPTWPCPTSRARSTASPSSVDAGPCCTSTPRTTRPVARSRPASSATQRDPRPARRGRLGRQPPGRDEQGRLPREVRPELRAADRRGPRRGGGLWQLGREGELRPDVHGRSRAGPSSSTRRDASRGRGRRCGRKATRRRCSPRSTRPAPAPDRGRETNEASLVGGNERRLGRDVTTPASVAQGADPVRPR